MAKEREIDWRRLKGTLLRQRETDADDIGLQTGYPGVKLAAASFRPCPNSAQSMEVVQYLTHAGETGTSLSPVLPTRRPGPPSFCGGGDWDRSRTSTEPEND